MQESATAARPWLHGPASDLLLGCGGLFTLLFVFFAAAGPRFFEALPLVVPALLVYLVGMPHYGATVVRVYDHREDRRAYALFSLWATLAIAAAFVVALGEPLLGSALFTLYLTWSPWHYAGQNYGIAVMFLGRRGVALPAHAKRCLHLSFVLSSLLVVVLLHLEDPTRAGPTGGIRLLPVGIPLGWAPPFFVAVLALHVASLIAFAVMALRLASPRTLLPAFAIVLTQALWHSLPIAMSGLGIHTTLVPLDRAQRAAFFTWIAAGHGIQYLWITSYYASTASDWRGTFRYYAKVLAAGTALWTIPTVFAAPRFGLPGVTGFFLLLASVVNLHHFVLDGAIWKLRNARIARVLLRSDAEPSDAASGGLARRAVWGVAVAGAGAAGLLFWVEHVTLPAALEEERAADAVRALDRLAWFQRDDAPLRLWAARRIEQQGDLDGAMRQYERSRALDPGIPVLTDLVRIHLERGERTTLADTCRALYAQLPADERVPLPEDARDFRDPRAAAACYRSAGRWRNRRAEEIAARAASQPTASGDGERLVLGY